MKIIQVTHSCNPELAGGAVIYCYELADSLRAQYEVKIFCGEVVSEKNVDIQRKNQWKRIEVALQPFTKRELDRPLSRYSTLYNGRVNESFKQYLVREKPDVVHFHYLLHLPVSLILVTRKMRIPTVLTLHDGGWFCPGLFFLRKETKEKCEKGSLGKCVCCLTYSEKREDILMTYVKNAIFLLFRNFYIRKVLNNVDRVISPSHFLENKYLYAGFSKGRIKVIQNGVAKELSTDSTKEKIIDSHNVRFGFLSGTSDFKGYSVVIDAIKILVPDNFSLHIWGPCEQTIIDTTLGKEGRKNIIFHGTYSHARIPEVLSGIDVLIFPSLFQENCPLTVLEALAHKIPVITNKNGGIPELIHEGINGYFIEHNNANDLSQNMSVLLENPSLIEKMRKNIGDVKSMKQHSHEIENVYRELVRP